MTAEWIRKEAVGICSDKCTKSLDMYADCCRLHDLCYWYAKDPFKAFELWQAGEVNYWHLAPSINQAQADLILRNCIQSKSWFGRFSPMSWWRYWTLRKLGGLAWNSHTATHID